MNPLVPPGVGVGCVLLPLNVAIAAVQLDAVPTVHSVDWVAVLPATKYPLNIGALVVTLVKAVCPIGPDVGAVVVFLVIAPMTSSGTCPS